MTDIDKIYELRFYSVEAERDRDIRARVQQDLKWLFPRHGIRPVGGWSAQAAPALPQFVYITPFKDMIERNRCWNDFYADPDWQEVRNRTNNGSELVPDYQIWFVRELVAWKDAPAGAPGSFDELVFLKTLVGKSGAAGQAIRIGELPAYERAGATILGAFDVVSGGTLPASLLFMRWADWATRQASADFLPDDPERTARIAAESINFGKPLLGNTGSYLLDPVPVDWD